MARPGQEWHSVRVGIGCDGEGKLPAYRRFLFHLAQISDFLKASREVSRTSAEILLRVCLVWEGGWTWGGRFWVSLMGGMRPIMPSTRVWRSTGFEGGGWSGGLRRVGASDLYQFRLGLTIGWYRRVGVAGSVGLGSCMSPGGWPASQGGVEIDSASALRASLRPTISVSGMSADSAMASRAGWRLWV